VDKNFDQKKEILLVPIGKVQVEVLGEIAVALRKVYKFHTRIGRSEEPSMEAYVDARRQYDAEKLLAMAGARQRDSLAAVLGVVDGDMYAGEKNFVFGVHQPEKSAAVIALTRLREEFYKKTPNTELFQRRAVTEAITQVGRALGLPVCPTKSCVFSAANTLWRLDEKDQLPDSTCQERLNTLHDQIAARRGNYASAGSSATAGTPAAAPAADPESGQPASPETQA